jgi:predicted RNA-binding protein with PUA-like domain
MWDGVRNFEARNNLRAMSKGDLALYYHSMEGLAIVGVARVVKEAYADPTADEGDWSAVDVAPVVALAAPVTLAQVKAHPTLKEMQLVKKSRISVVPVTPKEFAGVLKLAKTKLP